ncbi:B12-binding domain-containing radical SAM protein [Engelhardtia mirabilis]|uniref:B12 binding domain protein n=1 Tax=Engelhardtia mirabilis TaxID=2528011 RepID=A0A518BFK9_9BACT|nr:B12 binding domain protein [Planctomycetes bacterium Pla133]QDV00072.1 B12 binding domain protein [Planctomycetes bacterium Pla86]
MQILLVHPAFPRDTFWSFEHALEAAGRRATMPPLGLLTVAGLLPADRFELTLADENLGPTSDEAILAADVVFASAMIVQRQSLRRLVERCRRLGRPVVIGGPLVSACFSQLVEEGSGSAHFFIGEAEQAMGWLVEDLERGELRPAYAHVTDETRAQEVRDVFGPRTRCLVAARPSLDSSPLPRFDLLEMPAYHSMAVQTSRGCPIGCEFCDIWKQFGLKARTSATSRVLDQLSLLFTLGWRGRVFVVDDNFIGNVGAARSLLPELIRWQRDPKPCFLPSDLRRALGPARERRLLAGWRRDRRRRFPFAFSTEADVRIGMDAPKLTEVREAMVAAGFNSLFLGIETPDSASLLEAGKRVNVGKQGDAAANLLASVERIRRAGLEVMSGFIVGFDHDPPDIDRSMVAFIERAAIPVAMVGLLAVGPGTDLEARLAREGRLRGRFGGSQTHAFELDFEPRGRSRGVVVEQYARVLHALYGPGMGSFYARCETTIEQLPAPPRSGDRLGRRELLAFLRSLVSIRPRTDYWRFLARVLLRRPRFLGMAVVLALQGDHLQRLTAVRLEEYRRRSAHLGPEPRAVESTADRREEEPVDAVPV